MLHAPLLAQAAGETPFAKEFQTNANGSIVTIGNTLLTCAGQTSSSGVPCETALQQNANTRNALNNNSYSMEYLNAGSGDTAAPTNWPGAAQNASGQVLDLPPGAEVLWAGLYWGASLHNNTSSLNQGGVNGNETNMWKMSLKTPDGQYQTIEADKQFGPLTDSFWAYQGMADVTDMVKASGNGTYWGANVESAQGPAGVAGTGNYAGWSLVVVYTAPGEPMRNLTVFDGLVKVSDGHPQTITVDGFTAPDYGPRQTDLTMVAYEGDLAQGGDQAILNDTQLASAVSPGNNFFNSSIDNYGSNVTTGTPAITNTMGFDIKNITVGDAIPNGAHSATFQFSSTGDTYYPGLLGLAIDLYGPDYGTSTKTVNNLTGNNPAKLGDILEYTLTYNNTGEDAAKNVTVTDQIPAGTTYVANSLKVNGSKKTDAGGDDVGKVEGNTVTAYLGKGATASSGGTMACSGTGCNPDGSQTQTVRFRVKVTDPGITVTNIADINYNEATTGNPGSYRLSALTPVIPVADVLVSKSLPAGPIPAGASAPVTLTVTNAGPNDATNVVVTDPIPTGWQADTAGLPSNCQVSGANIVCTYATLAAGVTQNLNLPGKIDPATTATNLVNTVSVTSDTFDSNTKNNTAKAVTTLTRQADLQVTKTATGSTPGGPATWTVTMTNNGPSTAINPVLIDNLNDAKQATNISAQPELICSHTSATVVCQGPKTMPPGESWVVTVSGYLASNLGDDVAVVNTANGTSATPDPTPGNNTGTATIVTQMPTDPMTFIKTADQDYYVAGYPITYTIKAVNNSSADLTGVNINDDLSNTDFVDGSVSSPTPGSAITVTDSGWHLDCGTVTILAGETFECQVKGTPKDSAGNPILNTANATWDNGLGDSSTVFTPRYIPDYTNLTLNKVAVPTLTNTDGHEAFLAGGNFQYQITLAVPGNYADAENTVVTDQLPAGFTFTASDGVNCTASGTPQTITCDPITVKGAPYNTPVTITVNGTVAPGTAAEQVPNTATATTATPDQNGNTTVTSAPAPVDVINQADLQINKVAASPTVSQNGELTFTMTVTNNGPGDVDQAEVTDTLPNGFTVAAGTLPSNCAINNPAANPQVVRCQVGALKVNDPQLIQVTLDTKVGATTPTTQPGQPLYNLAEVSAPGVTDTNPENNKAQVPVSVTPGQVDLAMFKRGAALLSDGDTVTYSLTSTNIDSNDLVLNQTIITEQLPVGATLVSVGAASVTQPDAENPSAEIQSSCGNPDANNRLVCNLNGALPPGTQVQLPITVRFPSNLAPGSQMANLASVALPADSPFVETKPEIHNNAALVISTAKQHMELDIQKTLMTPVEMHQGDIATWHLTVRNVGTDDAKDVLITDAVPLGTTFVAANIVSGGTQAERTCPTPLTPAASEVDDRVVLGCDVGTIKPGQTAVVSLSVRVDPGTLGTICNTGITGGRLLDAQAKDNMTPVCGKVVAPPTTPPPVSPPPVNPPEPGPLTGTGTNLSTALWALVGTALGGAVTVAARRKPKAS